MGRYFSSESRYGETVYTVTVNVLCGITTLHPQGPVSNNRTPVVALTSERSCWPGHGGVAHQLTLTFNLRSYCQKKSAISNILFVTSSFARNSLLLFKSNVNTVTFPSWFKTEICLVNNRIQCRLYILWNISTCTYAVYSKPSTTCLNVLRYTITEPIPMKSTSRLSWKSAIAASGQCMRSEWTNSPAGALQ
jgi:hypothetical protein